jgi:MinD superfamily P-loop ATPase
MPGTIATEAAVNAHCRPQRKGGTGKTFLAVNLALVAEEAVYADCDVEEPNGWIFLQPEISAEEQVTVKIPAVDPDKCTGCRKCVEFCRFNALAYAGKVLVFPGICHSCGGCMLLCPERALAEVDRTVGIIQHGRAGHVEVRTGCLNLGKESGVPVIARLLAGLPAAGTVIIDCPPGSSCTVLESIKDSDYCLLVAEPTRYGLHNLQLVRELVTVLKKPFGVVLNKAVPGEKLVEDYCRREQIPGSYPL